MKRIVSIAIFGDGEKYSQYFYSFALAHLNLFPVREGWTLRVYVDDTVAGGCAGEGVRRLESEGLAEYRYMGSARGRDNQLLTTKAMMWRMAPVFENDVEYVFSRDIDHCPMPRDRAACEQFIISKAAVHTIHDNRAHTGIMGGLCGFLAPEFRKLTGLKSLEELYVFAGKSEAEWAQHGTDQIVLNRMTQVYRRMTLLEHRFSGWTEGKPTSYRREAAVYECEAWSTPMPDVGWPRPSNVLPPDPREQLANHLGAAGYDHVAARKFWEEYGDPQLATAVRACEEKSRA